MTRRKGGLGRYPGKGKRKQLQKRTSASAATAASYEAARQNRITNEKKEERARRRSAGAVLQDLPISYISRLEQAEREKEEAERRASEANQRAEEAEQAAWSAGRAASRAEQLLEKENEENSLLSDWLEREQRLKCTALERARAMEASLSRARAQSTALRKKKRVAEEKIVDLKTAALEEPGVGVAALAFSKVSSGVGRNRHALAWPLWVVQIIIEQLVNGTPPSAVSANIASIADNAKLSAEIHELPSISFIRRCRTVVCIIGETLAAYRLAKKDIWEQAFTDATSRRQVCFQNFVVGIMEDQDLRPIVLSSCIIVEDETSEKQVESVLRAIKSGGRRLLRWAEVVSRMYPDFGHDIPEEGSMNIAKLGRGGTITTDTCNSARKTRRLLIESVKAAVKSFLGSDVDVIVLEIDCWGHLRNIWLGGVTRALSEKLNSVFGDRLESIDPRLRISTSQESILRAVDKEFSLCANYPKGHGEIFLKWINVNHPGALLLHVERASGSRQDLAVEGAGAVYFNRRYYIEFLDERLRTPGDNILQENLFVILSSVEMIALSRVCSILHLAVCLPTRWLGGNCHKLSAFDWSVRSMGRMVDILEGALELIVADGRKILDEVFMMSIFCVLEEELPPLKEYVTYLYQRKRMPLVAEPAQRAMPFAELREELFTPTCEANIAASDMTAELGSVAAAAMLQELRDETKATASYLSSVSGKFSWGNTPDATHKACLGKMDTNDAAERDFGMTTGQLQCYGRVALASAGGVGQVRANGDLSRGFEENRRKEQRGKLGFFHTLPEEMRYSLLSVALEDVNASLDEDRDALDKQREAKHRKEEIAKEIAMGRATENYIDSIYYCEMHNSQACWRTTSMVDRETKKLKSKSAKLHALKENICMRVIGLGWQDLATPWSKNGVEASPEELVLHLKMIIGEQRKRVVPAKPPVMLPQRKVLPTLGTLAPDVVALNKGCEEVEAEFEAKARHERLEREAAGVGDRFSEMQPMSQPAVDSRLVGKRLDVCVLYNLDDGGTELRWCQGEVVLVSDGSNIVRRGARTACYKAGEAVMILWDANEERNELATQSAQRLLPSKWNPRGTHSEGCWRLDVEN